MFDFETWYDSVEEPYRLIITICLILPFMILFILAVEFVNLKLFMINGLYAMFLIRLKQRSYKKIRILFNIVIGITIIFIIGLFVL